MDINSILKDPNYTNANDATKKAIFDKYVGVDTNYTNANEATKEAIQQKWGVFGVTTPVEQNQTPAPQQEAPVSQKPASKQKANVEAPKFVAPTKVAPVDPKTIKPSTVAPFNKQKLVENEADLEVNLQKKADDINKEYQTKIAKEYYNNKPKSFASSSVYQDAYFTPKLTGTLKIGDKTFNVGNPQVNAVTLEKERVKKIDQIKAKGAFQKGKMVVGPQRQELLSDNEYFQVKTNDELVKLQEDRKYFADLLSEKNLLPESPSFVSSFGAPVKSRTGRGIKPEILAELGIETTGNPYKDYNLVKQKVTSEISNIDASISEKNEQVGLSKTDTKNLANQIDYTRNLLNFTESDVVFSAAQYKPKIAKKEKEISKNVGEITSIDIPSAQEDKLASAKTALLSSIASLLPVGIGATSSVLSALFNINKEPFSKKLEYKNLGKEKAQLLNYDDANKTIQKVNDIRLEKSYDDITSKFDISKDAVKSLAISMLNAPKLKPNERLQAPEGIDPALFNGLIETPQFNKIVNTYANSSSEFDIDGKKQRFSLAEANKITALKSREFGTIAKFEKDIEREQAYVDVLKKKSKDASVLSSDFYNNLVYETAYTLTYGKVGAKEIVGGALKVGSTIYEDQIGGKVSDATKANIDELIKSTDLYDVLVPTNSALQLSLFNPNKFITIKDQEGKNIGLEIDAMDEIKNVHAEDFAYVVRDPKQVEAIKNYYNENKEALLNTAKTLSNTEGGKRAIFDNTFRNVGKEVIKEGPTLAFEFTAGAGIAPFVANSDKLRKISQYGIAATSNMLETYPMIYKGYEENIDDPNNPYAAMLTTGGLGVVSLLTSGLDRKLIGLGQNAVSKEILPNVIKNSAPIIKAISKETLKITDKNLREATFKSAVSKVMIQEAMAAMKPAFKKVVGKAGEMGLETGGEVVEEIGTEPITQYVANFLNSAILDNQAYKQQTLDDLNFLDPETAWLTFWTAGAISSGANMVQSMQNNNPYTQVDYLKAALKKPDEIMKMLDNLEEDNSPEVIQKVKDDYNTLKTSYEEKKKDLNISQDLLESLDFQNPAVQIIMSQAGINKQVVDNIKGTKNYDALLIQQVLEEKKAKDLEAEILDGVSQGLIVEAENGYKAVGNNPLSKPYEKTIADFEKTNNNIQYFNNFISQFNNKTAPVQRQFVNELQKSLVVAPDLYDVKQENEDSSSLYYNVNAFNTLRTNTLSKIINEARLTEINNEINDKKADNQDVEQLQTEKKAVTQAIKESTDAINLIQQQYKAGRTETDAELKQTTETTKLAQIEFSTAIDAVSRMQDVDLDLDNHEINDIYEKYNQTVRDRNQVAAKLKKEYKVDVPMQREITPEQFSQVKEAITIKHSLGKNLESGKGNLADLNAFVSLSESLGTIVEDDTLQEPESSEDIDAIVNNPKQLALQAKAMNLSPLLSALNVKQRVSSKLHAQLNEAEQEKTLGINEILSTKIDQTSGQNTTYIIDGKAYTIANRPNSNTTTISEQQKSQIVLDELGREIARRIFSESMDLNPNTVQTIINKAISESYPELALELDENSLRLISANIAKLKMELENQGFNVLFNDKVISSVFAAPSESDNAIVGIATKIPLIAVSPNNEIHLINFKLFTGNTEDNLGIFNEEMTVVESLFKDNNVNITGIHLLPIKVKTTLKDNTLRVEKSSLDFTETDNPVSPSLIQLETNIALENDIFAELGTIVVEEEMAGSVGVGEEVKPTPEKLKVFGNEVNMYNNYIPSKIEDVEPDAMYRFNADSKDGIPSLLHDIAYANKKEVNGVKSENWYASIIGEDLLKFYPKKTPKAVSVEELRAQEQAEYDAMSDPTDEVERQRIYDRYDKLITPLLEQEVAEPIVEAPVEPVVEPQTPEFEGTIPDSEPVEPVSTTPVYNVGGTSNGVYIKVVVNTLANKAKRYKIVIENNPDLNDYYKNKVFETLKDVKDEYAKDAVYEVNGEEVVKQPWFTPKEINTGVTYQLQDAEGNSLKSPVALDLDNQINNLSSVSVLRGKEVTIEEVEDVNDSADVQSNFRKKSKLVVKFEGKAIAEIPSNSEIRFKLQFTKDETGKTRLLPTTASVNYIIQKDFDRTAPMPLTNWYDLFETANGKFERKIGYVKFEDGSYVLKTSDKVVNGLVKKGEIIYTYPQDKEPILGATYLVVTDANKKETRFPLQTPKLRDVVLSDGSKITKDEVIELINEVPTKDFNEKGKELYNKVVNGLKQVVATSEKTRIKEFSNLVAKDLGAENTPGRAASTEEQLATLASLPAYNAENKNEINGIIADFFLNRIITLTPESEGRHLITTNPNTVFLDNTVQVNNLVSGDYNEVQEAPRFQVATPQETPQDVVREMVDTLKGTGLANKVFEMTAEEIDAKLQELGVSEEVRKQVIAYHGSPYVFAKFLLSQIGTGEGAQAFGWGLYFTDLESIAKNYADKLGSEKITFDGVDINDTKGWNEAKEAVSTLTSTIDGYGFIRSIESIRKLASKAKSEYLPYLASDKITEIYKIQYQEYVDAANYLLDNIDKFKVEKGKNLYKVSLHKGKTPDQYTWLEWDMKPNKEQVKSLFSKLTQEQLDKGFYYGVKPDATNADIYKGLSRALGSDKQASIFLLENGIDGIKYPAESISRGATSKTARGFNYVVFDENAVTIEEQVKFQKALQEKGVNLVPTGFTYKGDVYLNMSNIRMDTPIHEFSHLLLDWMKVNKPELYQEGLKKVKAEMGKKDSVIKDVIEFVKTTQPNLTGEALENEILTEVSGRKGVDLLMSGQKSGITDWLKKFWAEVKNMLGLLDASIEQVANMTLEEYANAMAVQLLKGENIISIPKNEMKAFNEGVEAVQQIAEEYKIANKIRNTSHPKLTDLDVNMSEEISKEYDKSEHSPNNPEVKKAYEALERETLSQYDFIVEKGLKVEKWTGEGEPYANSKEMLKDLRDNNHLYFLPNDEAFGKETDVKEGRFGLKKVDKFLEDGYQMTLSEVFRVVHDYFGHGILGNQFGPIGEENATLQHLELYSTDAAPAVVYQTRGQNSWVNFSGANNEVFAMLEEAKKLRKENKLAESEKIKADALKMFNFAAPKDAILPNIYNFRKYETVRRIREQRNIEQQEAYLDPRGKYEDNDIPNILSRVYSSSSGKLGGLNRRNLGTNERVREYVVNVVAEYTLDKQTEEDIKKAFPAFKGVQKIYEISDGEVYRKLLIDSLEKEKFKASVTLHSAEEFSDMRMFITEDGDTGVTLTKDGFLGGGFSNPQNNRPNNLAQLMLVGIKEGAITAEAFATVLPDYYAQFGFKAVSRVAFNDELRPTVKNGAAADWDYDTYKDFNNGRPDIVFMIYDGGDRNTIQQRLGQFDLYSTYEKPQTESFDKNSYSDAYRFMEISAINKGLVENIGTVSTETPNIRFQESNIPQAIERNNGNPLTQAPNGKPSILYQSYKDLGYSDSEAERLTAQVYSDNFISWFGDWVNDPQNASKVVDENGQPLVVYHGTDNQFNTFSKKVKKENGRLLGSGFYFTSYKNNPFLKNVKEIKSVFLDIKEGVEFSEDSFNRPKDYYENRFNIIFEDESNFKEFEDYINKDKSFDGFYDLVSQIDMYSEDYLKKKSILNKDFIIKGRLSDEYKVISSSQIKSATENIGTFSKETPDIRFQMATEEETTQIPDCV